MQYVGSAIFNASTSVPPPVAFTIIVGAAQIADTTAEFDAAVSAGIMLFDILTEHAETR